MRAAAPKRLLQTCFAGLRYDAVLGRAGREIGDGVECDVAVAADAAL